MAGGGIVLARHGQAGRSGKLTPSIRPHPLGQPPHHGSVQDRNPCIR